MRGSAMFPRTRPRDDASVITTEFELDQGHADWYFARMAWLRILFVCLTASAALCACDNGKVPPPHTGGTGGRGGSAGSGGIHGSGGSAGSAGSAGTGGSAGSGGTGGHGGDGGLGGNGGTVSGGCVNENDLTALANLLPDNARTVAASCGIGCTQWLAFEPQYTACANACIEEAIADLSSECTNCYGRLSWCSRLLCLAPCSSDSCLTGCLTCQDYDPCLRDLDVCTGRMSLDCADEN